MPDSDSLPGLVVRAQSGFFEVETGHGRVIAKLRGRLTEGPHTTDRIALGDRVQVRLLEDGGGVIDSVEPRTRVLSRRDPGREVEQILVANPDQAAFVFACADPDPNFRLLDRLLVVAERENLPAIICANKIDLVVARSARAEFGEYERLGYPVHYVSAKTWQGDARATQSLGEEAVRLRRAIRGREVEPAQRPAAWPGAGDACGPAGHAQRAFTPPSSPHSCR